MNEQISTSDEVLQLKILLADWRSKSSLIDQISSLRKRKPETLTFSDVFTVSPNAVWNYVLKKGWNSERIQEVQCRPPDSFATAEYYIHTLGDQWCISALADKGEWIERRFATLGLARAEMVNMLFHGEWSGWNSKNRDHYLQKRGQPLSELYPPPPSVTIQ